MFFQECPANNEKNGNATLPFFGPLTGNRLPVPRHTGGPLSDIQKPATQRPPVPNCGFPNLRSQDLPRPF